MARWWQEVVWREAELLTRRVAAAIPSTAARVPHRGGSSAINAGLGGSFPKRIRASDFVIRKPWGAVVPWASKLPPTFRFFVDGTKSGGKVSRSGRSRRTRIGGTARQQPRPLVLTIDEARLVAALEEAAVAAYEKSEGEVA